MAAILQIAGANLISIAAFLLFPPAGLAIAGAFLILFGITIEKRRK